MVLKLKDGNTNIHEKIQMQKMVEKGQESS